MSDNMQQVRDDIDYIKQLAGDDGMVLRANGIGLMIGGIMFPMVGLRQHLIDTGIVDWPDGIEFLISFDGVLLFFMTLFLCFALDGRGN